MKRTITFFLVNLAGVAAFIGPLFAAAPIASDTAGARSSDAPWLLAFALPMLMMVALAELSSGKLDSKSIALLGVLAAFASVMRLPISFAGANLVFTIPILAGVVFGPRFGFLLGSTAMAASGLITGGVGPWLPFQMWAMGWVGMGAGVLSPALKNLRPRATMLVVCAFGFLAVMLYGGVMNLYFWPVMSQGDTAISFAPGIGPAESIARYLRFYALTSMSWDLMGGVFMAGVLAVCGLPVISVLARVKSRLFFTLLSPSVGADDHDLDQARIPLVA